MKCGITIQERLKDLRTERHLKLGELEKLTGICAVVFIILTFVLAMLF